MYDTLRSLAEFALEPGQVPAAGPGVVVRGRANDVQPVAFLPEDAVRPVVQTLGGECETGLLLVARLTEAADGLPVGVGMP